MSPGPPLNLEQFHFRQLHAQIRMGTASDRYAGWVGQIYTGERYGGRLGSRTRVVGWNYIERNEGEPEWITVPRAPGEIELGRRTEVYDYRHFPLNPPQLTGEVYILQLKYHLLRFRQGLKALL